MEAQAQKLTDDDVYPSRPLGRPSFLRARVLVQTGLFLGAFGTVAGLAVVLRPVKVDRPAPMASALMVAPAATDPNPTPITIDDMDQGTKDARAALAAALKSFGQAPAPSPAEAPAATPAPAKAQAAPAEASAPPARPVRTRLANLPRTANTPAPLPGDAAAYANGQGGAAGRALASIESVAPRTPLASADLQRMAGHAARAIRNGDIAGARAILQRAAEAGDATALFALAQTWDPEVLAKMRVRGMSGDAAKAEALYSQAADAGVAAAKERLARR